jgi:signal transduction histidine kinase
LFNKYYRGQRERERLEGVGLGLSIVKNIVESHHGTVWVNSQVGKGSTFGFTLPVHPNKHDGRRPSTRITIVEFS